MKSIVRTSTTPKTWNTFRGVLQALAIILTLTHLATAAGAACGGTPSVSTDQADYAPFATASITGNGFACGAVLSVLVTAPDGTTRSANGTGSAGPDFVTADENGAFLLRYRLSGTLAGGGVYTGQQGPYLVEVRSSSGSLLATAGFSDSFALHTCAVTTSGGVKCWGNNDFGQLGDGSKSGRSTPVDVVGLTSGVARISVGLLHTCAVTTSGGAKCWGDNVYGELGDGTVSLGRVTPTDVTGLTSGVAQISVGGNHTCAVTASGGAKCWGNNDYGQLGTGGTTSSPSPVDVTGLTSGVTQISAGVNYTCAVMATGAVKCWGDNQFGTLGDGGTTTRLTPGDVNGLSSGIAQVSTASGTACVLTTAGAAKCWGTNDRGQLGNGTKTNSFTPVNVTGLASGIAQIRAGDGHTCALASGGAVMCWGNNGAGQVGDGTTTERLTPTSVSGLSSGVSQITADVNHACALTAVGGVKCWGYNYSGELGNGSSGSTGANPTPGDVVGLTSGVAELPEHFAPVAGNQSPTAAAGGTYNGSEGSAIVLSNATASDPDSDPLSYSWTVSNTTLCSFANASILNASLTCTDNGSFTATLTVNDGHNPAVVRTATVTVANVAPTAQFGNLSAVDEGTSINLFLTGGTDPSSADTTAGFQYAFDCGSGYGPFSSTATATCDTSDSGTRAVKGKIQDKDGGMREYTANITINNVAPTATFSNNGPVNEGSNIALSLASPADPSSADTTAGFQYAFDCGSGYGPFSSTATASCDTSDSGTRSVKGKIQDKDGGMREYTSNVTITNVAPTATFANNGPVNEGSNITLSLTSPADSSSADATAGFQYAFDCGSGYGQLSSTATASCATSDSGMRAVKGKIQDKDGGMREYTANVTITNVAPTATFANNGPVNEGSNITLSLTSPSDPSSVDTTAGFQYAFDCGSGYGQLSATATATCGTADNGTRAVKGKIQDKDGGIREYTANVTISNVPPAIATVTGPGAPMAMGSTGTVVVNFVDPGGSDTHTCTFQWDDGSPNTTVTAAGAGSGSCTAAHTYTGAGVNTVGVIVTDKDSGVGTGQWEYVIVYDPSAGFVTGGGWINSVAGAYRANPALTGKATFGFVSKYKKGATTPTGETEFDFDVAGFEFHSDSYQWLVVSGCKAQYKGTGTVNGSGSYNFLLTAYDAQSGPGGSCGGQSVDRFRIKITDAAGAVVYDNSPGIADGIDSAEPQALGGGSIVLHN